MLHEGHGNKLGFAQVLFTDHDQIFQTPKLQLDTIPSPIAQVMLSAATSTTTLLASRPQTPQGAGVCLQAALGVWSLYPGIIQLISITDHAPTDTSPRRTASC